MLDAITAVCLAITDRLLNWLLYLPRDVGLVVLALGTALVLIGVRLFTTNQDLLRRCQADKARLKVLIREAKKNCDKEAVGRYRASVQRVAMTTLKAEGKPLLASLVPIALMATWACSRIAYLPVQAGDAVTLRLYTPVSAIGQWTHIVPQAGLQSETGWLREVREDRPAPDRMPATNAEGTDPAEKEPPEAAEPAIASGAAPRSGSPSAEPVPVLNGVAEWVLRGDKRRQPYAIQIRLKGRTIRTELIVDGIHYAGPPQRQYGEDPATEVVEVALAEYRPFGIVPGWAAAMLPPWILGYLILVIPLAFVLKPLLRIC